MELVVVHDILLCLQVTYDWGEPDQPYSLHNLVDLLRPPPGIEYPLLGTDLWVFVRVEGEDDQEFWIEVVRLTGDDEDEDELLGAYGPYLVPFGETRRTFSRAWRLRKLTFPCPGRYEFRFLHSDEIIAIETISLEG